MRREALERVGMYRKWPAAQDLDLFLRLAEIGKLANVREVLLHYRQHMGSVGHAKMAKQLETCRQIVTEAYARRGLTPAGTSASIASTSAARPSSTANGRGGHCKAVMSRRRESTRARRCENPRSHWNHGASCIARSADDERT
jgi:hypothetical protein